MLRKQIPQIEPAQQIPLTDWRAVTLSEQRAAFNEQQMKEDQDKRSGKLKARVGNAALSAFDATIAVSLAENMHTPDLGMNGARDLIVSYFLYRFTKGTVVRGATAITGKGDPLLALADTVTRGQLKRTRQSVKDTGMYRRDKVDLRKKYPSLVENLEPAHGK